MIHLSKNIAKSLLFDFNKYNILISIFPLSNKNNSILYFRLYILFNNIKLFYIINHIFKYLC